MDLSDIASAVFKSLIELATLAVAFISGILLSTVTFLLTYRFDWRNKLTKEFRVGLKLDHLTTNVNGIVDITINYELNCTSSDPFSINHVFLVLPGHIAGNSGFNATTSERIFNEKGVFYINNKALTFQHHYSDTFTFSDSRLITEINNRKIKKLRLAAATSKYGIVFSEQQIIIHASWWQHLKAIATGKAPPGIALKDQENRTA